MQVSNSYSHTRLLLRATIAVSGYAMITVLPMMWIIRAATIAENRLDYSLQNTAKHALFLPTTQEMKYKAKATIDSFFIRRAWLSILYPSNQHVSCVPYRNRRLAVELAAQAGLKLC